MSKNKKAAKGKGDDGGEDIKRDQKLQAILLADTFRGTFDPITWDKSTILLPLINIPMLEYTIEFLAQNGVEEIFIFCVWEAETIQSYVHSSRWPTLVSVRCITSTTCLSAGDALRELDSMGEVRSDPFVLISGDVVANLDLKRAIKVHKEKCAADHSCVMTVCMKKMAPEGCKVRPVRDDLIVGMDKNTGQIVLFNDNINKSSVSLPVQVMSEHSAVAFHTDLLDCHVDICSPALLLQFSDNFDYQDIRKHFIQNEAVNWELGMHIYGHLLHNSEYAARVTDPRTYHTVCLDIINRWVHPIVPEYQFGGSVGGRMATNYTQMKHNIYRDRGVKLSRTARLSDSVVIGKDCVVGDGVFVEKSVVGNGCQLGRGVRITHSHLWEGVVLEENVSITCAIIAENVKIGKNAVVGRGCIIAHDVMLDDNVVVPDYTRIMTTQQWESGGADEDDRNYEELCALHAHEPKKPYDVKVVGKNGVGYVWEYRDNEIYFFDDSAGAAGGDDGDFDDDDDEEDGTWGLSSVRSGVHKIDVVKASSIGCSEEDTMRWNRWKQMNLPFADDEMYKEDGNDDDGSDADGNGFGEDLSLDVHSISLKDKSSAASAANTSSSSFYGVIKDMVGVGIETNQQVENVLLEVKGFKFAQNKEFADCLKPAVSALFDKISKVAGISAAGSSGDAPTCGSEAQKIKIIQAIKQVCTNESSWGFKMIKGLALAEVDEVAVIDSIEDYCLLPSSAGIFTATIFRFTMQLFYDSELLSDEAIMQWIKLRRAAAESGSAAADHGGDGDASQAARVQLFNDQNVQDFVDWMDASDEEDDDDDAEDSESEEDEDDDA